KKEKHRAFTFVPGPATADPLAATVAAIRFTARNLVEAPYRNFASNFGLAALERQARLCTDRKDKRGWPRVFGSGPLACLALYRPWEGITLELTAPAGGRALYAEFLDEAATLPGLESLLAAADLARQSAEQFSAMADAIVATDPAVAEAVELSEEIDALHRAGESEDGASDLASLGERASALRAQREAATTRCELDAAGREAAFAMVGEGFAAIHRIETELQAVLSEV